MGKAKGEMAFKWQHNKLGTLSREKGGLVLTDTQTQRTISAVNYIVRAIEI